jgi:plasmid stability protein
MPNLTIKGVPQRLYLRLKRRAARHRRSLNSEVIICLEQAVDAALIDPESWLASVDRLRVRLSLTPLTKGALRKAKARGRP